MARKSISRILNRTIDNLDDSSFNETNVDEGSFTTFCFEEADRVSESELNHETNKTDYYYSEQRQEESFSKRERPVYEHFEKEKKFLGTITDINVPERTFSADLICTDDDIKRNVLFSIDDLSSEDCLHVEVGRRIIYIYGKQYRNGTATNVSNIYFRNDSNWTEREIELKRKEANELFNFLSNKGVD